jgi:two-component system, chemotaxis family, chemotaxis protein CheY
MKPFRLIRVLVVDDNRQMRVLTRELLRALEMRSCFEAGDADEGMATLKSCRADLVITDLAMGKQDGISFARRIRMSTESVAPTTPIIMMTGHAEMSRVAAAIDAGVNTFLAKPISARSLADHVASALNDRRPFIRTATFFGPDRRRRQLPHYPGPHRRAEDHYVELEDEGRGFSLRS